MGRYATCAEALQALAQGPGDFACHDFDTVREVVMCDAWHKMETDHTDFKTALDQSWSQVKTACEPVGGITPEVRPEHRAEAVTTYAIMDGQNQSIGRVVVDGADGSVTTCIHDACHTDFLEPAADLRQAIVAAMRDIYPTVGYHLQKEG